MEGASNWMGTACCIGVARCACGRRAPGCCCAGSDVARRSPREAVIRMCCMATSRRCGGDDVTMMANVAGTFQRDRVPMTRSQYVIHRPLDGGSDCAVRSQRLHAPHEVQIALHAARQVHVEVRRPPHLLPAGGHGGSDLARDRTVLRL